MLLVVLPGIEPAFTDHATLLEIPQSIPVLCDITGILAILHCTRGIAKGCGVEFLLDLPEFVVVPILHPGIRLGLSWPRLSMRIEPLVRSLSSYLASNTFLPDAVWMFDDDRKDGNGTTLIRKHVYSC